jgi:hypothetical protein
MNNKQYPPCMCQPPMMNVPMSNIPMANIPMANVPAANIPMANAPMPNVYHGAEIYEIEDKELEKLFPRSYHKAIPMVNYHCDVLEGQYGCAHIPTKEQVDAITDDVYKKLEKELEEDIDHKEMIREESSEDEDETRRRRYGRRRLFRDIIGIALIDQLLGRRRRRRRPTYYGPGYWY